MDKMCTPAEINDAAHRMIDMLPISAIDAYILLKELLDSSKGRGNKVTRARRCIRLGAEALKKAERTVSFFHAFTASLEAREHRRKRTLQEIRYFVNRMLKICQEWKNKQMRNITVQDCKKLLDECFKTPRQWSKGRVILSGIFSYALRQGWCEQNPLMQLSAPFVTERRIFPLSLYETRQLLRTATSLYNGECLPACALMLYAGLRPEETRRLTWDKVNLKAGVINIVPLHSKTGGGRQVLIRPILAELLKKYVPDHKKNTTVCPSNWGKKWSTVRRHSGILKKTGWVQDVLRHTYASYHQACFNDRALLQREMGHCGSKLLESRYLNMERITPATGKKFWELNNPWTMVD